MIEIRIHGRGGQGAVSTGQLMAIAAFYDGKQSQSFPVFGVERSGAPVQAFCRIDEKPIHLRSQVYEPDIVLVLDTSLIQAVDITKGLKKGGTIIVNTNKKPKELGIKGDYKLYTVDATSIAMEVFGKAIVNTLVLGALSKITKVISKKSIDKAIEEIFLYSKGQKVVDSNKKAIEKIYQVA